MTDPGQKPRLTKRRIFGLAVAIAALWLAWQVYDIITGKPQPKIDYATQFHELCSNAQPEGENAWPLLLQVLDRAAAAQQALKDDPAATQHYSDGTTSLGSFGDVLYLSLDSPKARPHIYALDELYGNGTFDMMAQVAAMPRCVEPRIDGAPFSDVFNRERMPRGGSLRQLARICAARMRLAAFDGRWDQYRDATDQALATYRFAEFQPSLLDHLIAFACIDLVLGELNTTLVEQQLDESTARSLLEIVDRRMDLPSPDYVMSGELLLQLDYLQNQYTPSGRLPTSSYGQFGRSSFAALSGTAAPKTWQQTLGDVLSVAWPGRAAAEDLERQYVKEVVDLAERDGKSDLSADGWDRPLPLNQVVIQTITMNPETMAYGWRIERHAIAATRLMLAIEIYIAQHNRAPDRLADLVPDILPEIPIDSINGQSWGYERLLDGSDQTAFRLWSFGRDGEDNQGYEGENPLWDVAKPGTDVLINKPRHVPDGLIQ